MWCMNNWLGWSQSNAPKILSKPSQNLQLQIISWIVEDKIEFRGITKDILGEKLYIENENSPTTSEQTCSDVT